MFSWCLHLLQLVEAKLKRVYLEGQAARAEGQTTRSLVASAAASAPMPAAIVRPPSPPNGVSEKADEADANMVALLAAESRYGGWTSHPCPPAIGGMPSSC